MEGGVVPWRNSPWYWDGARGCGIGDGKSSDCLDGLVDAILHLCSGSG